MSKTNDAPRKTPTHFATVPIEVVKEIAIEDLPTDQLAGGASVKTVRRIKKSGPMPGSSREPSGKRR